MSLLSAMALNAACTRSCQPGVSSYASTVRPAAVDQRPVVGDRVDAEHRQARDRWPGRPRSRRSQPGRRAAGSAPARRTRRACPARTGTRRCSSPRRPPRREAGVLEGAVLEPGAAGQARRSRRGRGRPPGQAARDRPRSATPRTPWPSTGPVRRRRRPGRPASRPAGSAAARAAVALLATVRKPMCANCSGKSPS